MLPESKNDFPKCLYLDQNKWIDLARSHYGKPEGIQFQPCLEAVRAAVKSEKLLVPFSVWNAIEAMIPRDAGRRQRLAEFMVVSSANKTLSPENVVAPAEIVNATRQLFGMPATEAPRKSLVHVGIVHAIGMGQELQSALPPMLNAAFTTFMGTPEATIKFLVDSGEQRDHIQAARDGEAQAKAIFQSDRAVTDGMSHSARLKAELFGLFSKNAEYRVALETTLAQVDRTVDDFKAEMKSDDSLSAYVAAIPNFDVFITLRMVRDLDKDRKVDHNDIRDLDWLSVAVPYSNIVVSEQYWGKKIVTTGLVAKYNTVVLTNLQDLPSQLSAMGCLG